MTLLSSSLLSQVTVHRVTTVTGTTSTRTTDVNALSLNLNLPIGIARSPSTELFVGDFLNNRIYKLSPAGRATVLAGTGVAGFTGTNGPGTEAQITKPRAMAHDIGRSKLYFSDVWYQPGTPRGSIERLG